jgi:hypothetical protein
VNTITVVHSDDRCHPVVVILKTEERCHPQPLSQDTLLTLITQSEGTVTTFESTRNSQMR